VTGLPVWSGMVAGAVAAPALLAAAHRLRRQTGRPVGVPVTVRVAVVIGLSVATVTAAALAPTGWFAGLYAVFAVLATTAAAVDLVELRLPDTLTFPLAVIGIVAAAVQSFVAGSGAPLWRALAGGVLYGGWMLIAALVIPHGWGLGDVKLAAGVGTWLAAVSWSALASGVLYGQLLVVLSLLMVRLPRRGTAAAPREAPLGPALVAGAAGALLATWSM
jgi:leader peptidase (prepilin peptidase) / N-methyltransferase